MIDKIIIFILNLCPDLRIEPLVKVKVRKAQPWERGYYE